MTSKGEPSAADILMWEVGASLSCFCCSREDAKGELMQETAAPLSTSACVWVELMKQDKWGLSDVPVCTIAFKERWQVSAPLSPTWENPSRGFRGILQS